MAVAMTVAVAMAVPVEQDQTDDVDEESCDADVQHPVGMFNLVLVCQSLDCLDEDREAQRNQKHRVDEGTEHLGASPAVSVLV